MKSHWPISILSTLTSLINMLMPLVLVRILTVEEIGQFKIFFLYLTLFPPFALMTGVTNGLFYWGGRGETGRALIRVSGRMILATALAMAMLGLALHPLLMQHMGWSRVTSVLFACALFTGMSATFYEDSAVALGQVWRGAIFGSGWDFVRTVAILITALWTRSLVAVFAAHTGAQFLKVVLAYSMSERQFLRGAHPVEQSIRKVLEYSFPVSVACLFGILMNYSDQILLSKYLTSAEFAFYAVGCLSVPPLTILEMSVTRVLIPQLSAAFEQKESERAAHLYSKAVEELAFLVIPAVAGMVVFAKPIIQLLFTAQFAGADAFLKVYAFSYLALLIPYDSVARSRGESKWIFWNFLFFATLSLGLCFALIRQYGAMGTLVGALGAKFLMRAYGVYYIRKSSRWSFSQFLPLRQTLRFVVISVMLSVLVRLAKPYFASELKWFLVMGSFFAFLYFLVAGIWSRISFRLRPQVKKVLILTQHIGLGGLERMIYNLSLELQAQREWETQVFVFDHSSDAQEDSHLGPAFERAKIPITLFNKKSGFSWRAVIKITQRVLMDDVSVIHSHDLGALIYGVMVKVLTLGRIRLVHTQHSFVHLSRSRKYQMYERFFARMADVLTVVSPDTKQTYLELGLPSDQIHVVPNGVKFPPQGPILMAERQDHREQLIRTTGFTQLREFRNAHWLLYMARLFPGKGQPRAVDVWEKLSPEIRKKLVLLVVGPESKAGQVDQLRQRIAGAVDSSRILYLGPTQTPELWLKSAEVSLSCSEFEGLPLGPIEAGGAGLPLILSRIPGHEPIRSWSAQFDLQNPEEGARLIEHVVGELEQDPDAYLARCWSSTQELRTRYSLTEMARTYSRFYSWKK